jgi:thioredoxin 1
MPKEEVKLGMKIESEDAFQNKIINADSNRLFIIDVHTDWCGPCTSFEMTLKTVAMSTEGFDERCMYCTCERKNWPEFAERFPATSMPRFVFYKEGQELLYIEGVRAPEILRAMQEHMPPLLTEDD